MTTRTFTAFTIHIATVFAFLQCSCRLLLLSQPIFSFYTSYYVAHQLCCFFPSCPQFHHSLCNTQFLCICSCCSSYSTMNRIIYISLSILQISMLTILFHQGPKTRQLVILNHYFYSRMLDLYLSKERYRQSGDRNDRSDLNLVLGKLLKRAYVMLLFQ